MRKGPKIKHHAIRHLSYSCAEQQNIRIIRNWNRYNFVVKPLSILPLRKIVAKKCHMSPRVNMDRCQWNASVANEF
jgi:hypothetical protein